MDDWNEKVCTIYPYNAIVKGLSITPKVIASATHRLFISRIVNEFVSPEIALYKLLYLHDKAITHSKDPLETLIELIGKVNVPRVIAAVRENAVTTVDIIESRLGISDALFRCAFKPQTPSDAKDLYYNPITQLNYKTPGNFPYSSTLLRIVCHDQQIFQQYLFMEYGLTRDITDDVNLSIKSKERINLDNQRLVTLEELKRLKYYHEKTGIGTDSHKLYYRILPFLESASGKPQRKAIPKAIKTTLWDVYYPGRLTGPCYTCGKEIDARHFEAGHVIPASEGGPDTVDNLRPICKPCNASMSNMELYEYKKRYHSPATSIGVGTKKERSVEKDPIGVCRKERSVEKEIADDFVIVQTIYDSRVEFHKLYRSHHGEITTDYKAWCSFNSRPFASKEMEEYLSSHGCEKVTDGKVYYTGIRLIGKSSTPVDKYQETFDQKVKKYKDDEFLSAKLLRDLQRLGVTPPIVREMIRARKDVYPKFVLDELTKYSS